MCTPTARHLSMIAFFGACCLPGRMLAADEKPAELPLKRIVLFNSGVGFFEHSGQIDGDRKIEMKFKTEDISDLLKSMVLRDLSGGHISAVTYDSQDPLTKTLKTFAIDLTRSPTLADLLRQICGHRVQVDAPTPIVGVIIGVEKRRMPVGKEEMIETEVLNLKTDTGLRSVPLSQVVETRLLDERLNAELHEALAVLAKAHAMDKKSLTLHFQGEGARAVRVGYIQESPVWKTSYRLVLKDDEAPFLQGWAIVENMTDHDWNGVQMTLVSGRPVSFQMDLYQALYAERPFVVPESFAALQSRTYDQDLASREAQFEELAVDAGATPRRRFRGGRGGAGGGAMGGGGAFGGGSRPAYASGEDDKAKSREPLDLNRGVVTAAQGEDVGELFRYVITAPVSLTRQKSAMLPIVNDSVKGEKLCIYNADVHAKHPMNGLRLINSTSLHLMQGPITVFDGGEYAGDARIEDIPPGSERLISYALDLNCEVSPETKPQVDEFVGAKIVKGVLHKVHKGTSTRQFTVKNSGEKVKKVLIEEPLDKNWTLIEPTKPLQTTRDLYRFAVTAEPGKTATLVLRSERIQKEELAVGKLDDEQAAFLNKSGAVSNEIKQALAEIAKQKQALASITDSLKLLVGQLKEVDEEQSRIRQNMAQLDRTSELYKRYVAKFATQEDQVEKLRKEIRQKIDEEARQQKSLDAYVDGLNLS